MKENHLSEFYERVLHTNSHRLRSVFQAISLGGVTGLLNVTIHEATSISNHE